MNELFAQYTSNVAFRVSLSMVQCNTLLRLEANSKDVSVQVGTLKPLHNMGLVYWKTNGLGQSISFEGLTKAGEIMCMLLKESGLTVDNTNSVGTLKRLERLGVL